MRRYGLSHRLSSSLIVSHRLSSSLIVSHRSVISGGSVAAQIIGCPLARGEARHMYVRWGFTWASSEGWCLLILSDTSLPLSPPLSLSLSLLSLSLSVSLFLSRSRSLSLSLSLSLCDGCSRKGVREREVVNPLSCGGGAGDGGPLQLHRLHRRLHLGGAGLGATKLRRRLSGGSGGGGGGIGQGFRLVHFSA